MKEKAWITTIDGDEMCIEVDVSWSREQEELLRKDRVNKISEYIIWLSGSEYEELSKKYQMKKLLD